MIKDAVPCGAIGKNESESEKAFLH